MSPYSDQFVWLRFQSTTQQNTHQDETGGTHAYIEGVYHLLEYSLMEAGATATSYRAFVRPFFLLALIRFCDWRGNRTRFLSPTLINGVLDLEDPYVYVHNSIEILCLPLLLIQTCY
jgi:hypothetical protein